MQENCRHQREASGLAPPLAGMALLFRKRGMAVTTGAHHHAFPVPARGRGLCDRAARAFAFLLLGLLGSMGALQEAAAGNGAAATRPLSLAFGPNAVDLNGDGRKDLILKSWHERHNASGHIVYQFLINSGAKAPLFIEQRPEMPPRRGDLWEVVMIRDPERGHEKPVLMEEESGQCTLRAAVVFPAGKGAQEGAVLAVAEKRGFEDFIESLPVNIDLYALITDGDDVAGQPEYRFERLQNVMTKGSYCDARRALMTFLAGKDN